MHNGEVWTVVKRLVEWLRSWRLLSLRSAVVAVFVVWCFQIARPFLVPVLWGMIIAVALFPTYRKLVSLLGGRRKIAASLVTVVLLMVLIVPTVLLGETLVNGARNLGQALADAATA